MNTHIKILYTIIAILIITDVLIISENLSYREDIGYELFSIDKRIRDAFVAIHSYR